MLVALPIVLLALVSVAQGEGKRAVKQPDTPYGPDWQSYFRVSDSLPGVSSALPTSYAGTVSVNRSDASDAALFFWAFEANSGSLSAKAGERAEEPWAIWLNGGPGRSSMNGLFNENGPLLIGPNQTLQENPYSWHTLADTFWIDQPVGVGFSPTPSSSAGWAAGQVELSADFLHFLTNLVSVFPSLSTRPLYLTGESYAGRYIPYITRALLKADSAPVKLAKIAVAAPALGSRDEFKIMPVLETLAAHPALIGWDVDVYNYFEQQSKLCNLNVDLAYPQTDPLPWIRIDNHGDPARKASQNDTDAAGDDDAERKLGRSLSFEYEVRSRAEKRYGTGGMTQLRRRDVAEERRELGKRSLEGRANGTIDAWYGCELFDEMVDYAVNYTWPWSESKEVDTFNLPDAVNPDTPTSPAWFLNNDDVKAAIHAPNKNWSLSTDYAWGGRTSAGDPSPASYTILDELASLTDAAGVRAVFFVGNDDGLSPHFGTQATIQNTTFGGTRGFTKRPDTPWYDDDGTFAGIVHSERGWTFALVYGAGHQIAVQRPGAMFAFARDYIFSDGVDSVKPETKDVQDARGGGQQDDTAHAHAVIPANEGIAHGRWTTEGVSSAPAATRDAFFSAIGVQRLEGDVTKNVGSRTATPTRTTFAFGPTGSAASTGKKGGGGKKNGTLPGRHRVGCTWVVAVVAVVVGLATF